MKRITLITITIVFLCFSSQVFSLITIGYSDVRILGDWGLNSYGGEHAYNISVDFGGDRVSFIAPDIGFATLGPDMRLQKYLQSELGFLPFEVKDIKATLWYFGGGIKVNLLDNSYFTPYLQFNYYIYRKGIKMGWLSIPLFTDFSTVLYKHGPGVGAGIELFPNSIVSGVAGIKYLYGFNASTTDIEEELFNEKPQDTQLLIFFAGVDFL
jgi:hypothetical protein